jgi:hypothetical protein
VVDAPTLQKDRPPPPAPAPAGAGPAIVPSVGALDTLHIGVDDLPWMDIGDGGALQILHVDLNIGLWISQRSIGRDATSERGVSAAQSHPVLRHDDRALRRPLPKGSPPQGGGAIRTFRRRRNALSR